MSVKASITKATKTTTTSNSVGSTPVNRTGTTQAIIDVEADSADAIAKELGITSETTIATEAGVEVIQGNPVPPVTSGTGNSLIVRPEASVNPYTANSGGALEGEFDMNDLRMPQLKLVNGSGELSQKWNQGTLLFADELLWNPPNIQPGAKNPTLIFIPVRIKKQFRENLSQEEVQEGAMPRVVNTRAEAEEMGGSTVWAGNQKPRWSPSAACMFLLQEPEHQDRLDEDRHPAFSYQLDGKNWALGMYFAGGVAYNESAKLILSNAYTVLKEKGQIVLHKRLWTFQVGKKKAGNFSIFVPVMRLTRENTGPEAVEFIQSIMSAGAVE
jgi:hypothetical protein